MTNQRNTVLYIGVTNDLKKRVTEHKTKLNPKAFTSKYNIDKLVYFESFETMWEAILREKFLKGKKRVWKEKMISMKNPEWLELVGSI